MKYIFGFLTIAFLMVGCSGGDTSGPKTTVAAFIEALKKGDVDGIKKLITKNDVSLLEFGESMLKQMGKDSLVADKLKQEFVEKSKNVSFTIKDEKIDGDKADVNVEIKDKDSTQIHPFKLIKEDGNWKISLMSTGLNMGGNHHGDMDNPNVNIADSIKKHLENMNMDSLKGKMQESLEKLKEIEKNNPEAAKRMEEAMKKLGQH